jgi:iron complex transport system permease protein
MRKDSVSKLILVLSVIVVLILVIFYLSVTNGSFDIPALDVFKTLLHLNSSSEYELVLFEFRLPRIVIGALVGFGLAIAGMLVQGVTKNPLADPGILGINSGASVAIVLFMFFFQGKLTGASTTTHLSMPLFGLIGGLASSLFIYLFSWKNGKLDAQRLILCGLAISTGLGALSTYITLKMNPKDFEMAAVWINGSIWNANWKNIFSILPWFILLLPVIFYRAPLLDLLQLEESTIKSLGISSEKEKAFFLLGCIGMVSSCVSVSGNIGFVGLIAPHISKRLLGVHHKHSIIVCGLIGTLLVLTADFIGKSFFKPVELPAGIIISLIGVPYFVYLLVKTKA